MCRFWVYSGEELKFNAGEGKRGSPERHAM
jgi:hypothetical protein